MLMAGAGQCLRATVLEELSLLINGKRAFDNTAEYGKIERLLAKEATDLNVVPVCLLHLLLRSICAFVTVTY